MQLALLDINSKNKLDILLQFAQSNDIDLQLFESEVVEDYLLGRLMEKTLKSKRNSSSLVKKTIEDALHSE